MDDGANVLPFPQAPDAIELRHLRAFVAVAEELSFSRAAERLYLSPPALSRQIRSLEQLVGCRLLRRSTHSVELTLAGEALLDRARPVLRAVDEAVAMTQSVGGELVGRMARLLEPVAEQLSGDADLHDVRAAFEALHAQFSPPPEVGVQPVNANGVPSLLLTPPRAEGGAGLLYLHGGAFVLGSAFGYRHLAGALAVAAETDTLVPDYRLAPEHPFPAALDDALNAYQWMLDRGTPPERIVLAGDSAGGMLVLSLLIALKRRGRSLPAGAVLLCPVADLEAAATGPPPQVERVRAWIAAFVGDHPRDDPVLRPLSADLSGLPPMLVQVATGDDQLKQGYRLANRARKCGVDARLELYALATHGFQFFWSFLPEAADAVQRAGRFANDARRRDRSVAQLQPAS